jgi:hypothetical protein
MLQYFFAMSTLEQRRQYRIEPAPGKPRIVT